MRSLIQAARKASARAHGTSSKMNSISSLLPALKFNRNSRRQHLSNKPSLSTLNYSNLILKTTPFESILK